MSYEQAQTILTNNPYEFKFLTTMMPQAETGIKISGATKVDDTISVLTEKEVQCKTKEETLTTYQKVMDIRELTPKEETLVAKAKSRLKLVYNNIFKGNKYVLISSLTLSILATFNLSVANYFAVFTDLAFILMVLGPKKLLTGIKKIFASSKVKKEAEEHLDEYHLKTAALMVDNDEDIKMYVKVKSGK